jgi:hypothetical protein
MIPWIAIVAPAQAEVVDRVVASVDEAIITASDVRLETSMARWDRSPSPFFARGEPLERTIDASIIRRLAGDLALYQPTESEAVARVEAMRARMGEEDPTGPGWKAMQEDGGVDDDGLVAAMRGRIVVERYLARTLSAPIGDIPRWNAACDALLDQARRRFRIRRIAEEPR